MKVYRILLVLVLFSFCNISFSGKRSRKKRLLHFPEKTNVVLLPSETIVNTLTEVDVLFPVPLHPYIASYRIKRDIERNMIYDKLKAAFEHLGFNGSLHLERLICRITFVFKEKSENEDNLLKDIFNLLFDVNGELFKNCASD